MRYFLSRWAYTTHCALCKTVITGKKYIVIATLQLRFYTHIRSVIKLHSNAFTGDALTSDAETVPAGSAPTAYNQKVECHLQRDDS